MGVHEHWALKVVDNFLPGTYWLPGLNAEKWLKLWEKHLMMTSLESHVHKNILERIKEIHYAAYMIGKADRGDEILKQLRVG